MKVIIGLLLLLVIVAFGITYTQNLTKNGLSPFTLFRQSPTATIQNRSYKLIIAKELKDIEIGLSSRKSLPENEGMLFIFDKTDIYPFWMRDMKFPIDILFIKDNKIITIYDDVQPPTDKENIPIYKPSIPIDKVLEINARQAKKNKIKEGDIIQFKNL